MRRECAIGMHGGKEGKVFRKVIAENRGSLEVSRKIKMRIKENN